MYSPTFLKNGDQLHDTHSAMILEKLIGQLVYKLGNSGPSESAATDKVDTKSVQPATLNKDNTHEQN